MWLEAQTKKGTHDACHVYTHLWLNLTLSIVVEAQYGGGTCTLVCGVATVEGWICKTPCTASLESLN